MIKKYTEFVEHKNKYVTFTFDTSKIKSECVDCHYNILGDLEQNYIKRGNYCAQCSAKHY